MSPPFSFLDPTSTISKLMGCSAMMLSGGEHNTDVSDTWSATSGSGRETLNDVLSSVST